MEDSKAQNKILELGKAIVKELELDPGVDTLSKWMAHYVSEKMVLAESLKGDLKTEAEKECFELISKLWEHRWSIPRNKPFLQDFEPLFETVSKLDLDRNDPFFLMPKLIADIKLLPDTPKTANDSLDNNLNPQTYLDSVLKVDKIARLLIVDLLNRGVSKIKLEAEREETIRKSIEAIKYPEGNIIRIVSDYDQYLESQSEGEDINEEERISELKDRVSELEELMGFIESSISRYKQEILKI